MAFVPNKVKQALEDGHVDEVQRLLETGHDAILDNLLHDCLAPAVYDLGPRDTLRAVELLLRFL